MHRIENGLRLCILFPRQLEDRTFMRDFYANVGFFFRGGKGLLIHGANDPSPSSLGMLSKKIGAALSEEMIVNAAFSGFQRQMLVARPNGPEIRVSILEDLFKTLDVVVLNTLADSNIAGNPTRYLEPDENLVAALVAQLEQAFGSVRTLLFPENPLSPLGAMQPSLLNRPADCERRIEIFPEEAKVLRIAQRALPAVVCHPSMLKTLN
ncbi:MAG: hypothetical protein RMM53_02130 [Bacteroidia bacterium]|nr:hypothetical protein [Bacteroidia bacterium]MDW8332993.1 hypothetical protein [Bacteroidia bacterium]